MPVKRSISEKELNSGKFKISGEEHQKIAVAKNMRAATKSLDAVESATVALEKTAGALIAALDKATPEKPPSPPVIMPATQPPARYHQKKTKWLLKVDRGVDGLITEVMMEEV